MPARQCGIARQKDRQFAELLCLQIKDVQVSAIFEDNEISSQAGPLDIEILEFG